MIQPGLKSKRRKPEEAGGRVLSAREHLWSLHLPPLSFGAQRSCCVRSKRKRGSFPFVLLLKDMTYGLVDARSDFLLLNKHRLRLRPDTLSTCFPSVTTRVFRHSLLPCDPLKTATRGCFCLTALHIC